MTREFSYVIFLLMLQDLLLIFYCWFLSSLWIFIPFPFTHRFTKDKLLDAGWALNRTLGWLLIGLPVWYLAHLGLPINTRPGVWIVFAILAVCSWFYANKNLNNLSEFFRQKKTIILIEETLFLIGLFFLSIMRGYGPDINSLEKFMDAGLIVSYVKSPQLPIEDMWLAGMNFNYYTFGHFQGAVATQFWSIDPVISYNILLGLLMGLSLQLSFALIVNLLHYLVPQSQPLALKIPLVKKVAARFFSTKPSMMPILAIGIIGAYLFAFGGNLQTVWYLFARCYSKSTQTAINFAPADENAKPIIADACSFVGYWYPNATRFIPRTIHEFPSYSFIVSDLHAHVWNIAHVLVLLHLILIWGQFLLVHDKKPITPTFQKKFFAVNSVLGILMGVFVMTSTWDALVYALVFSIMSLLLLLYRPSLLLQLMFSGIIIFLGMIIASSPWWLNFDSISEGAAITNEHSLLWHLLVLWTAHVVSGLIGAFLIFKLTVKKKQVHFAHLMVLGLVLSGICLIILPEFFYIKDIYTTQPRANTMFKLTYQAFVQLSIVMAVALGILSSKIELHKSLKIGLSAIIIVLMICIGIYPYFGYRDFYLGGKPPYKGLDGLLWFKQQYPDDYEAYLWLKKIDGRPHILEAVGDSYTTFNRMSTFTGLPTVLGWRVHEWLWRGSYDIPGKRSSEVESIYNSPTTDESQRLLNQYLVKFIIVGDKEHEAYPQLDPLELKKLGKVVFEQGNTFIVERD